MNMSYYFWLLASICAGNKVSYEERSMLNSFLRPKACPSR